MKRYSSNIITKTGAWSLFNTLKPRNQKLFKLPPHETCDSLNQYFCTVAFLKPEDKIDTLLSETALNNPDSFHFTVKNVTKSDVYLAWKQMKHTKRKTEDPLGISNYMIDSLMPLPSFFDMLVKFSNLSFNSGTLPEALKIAKVIPIPKIPQPKTLGDFRPISITPNITLLLEKIFLNRLEIYLSNHKIISKNQFGFRRNHSTEMAIIALTDNVKKILDLNRVCVIVALDFRKAFDSVPRESLLKKIAAKYKVSDFWLRNYLANRYQYVEINGVR